MIILKDTDNISVASTSRFTCCSITVMQKLKYGKYAIALTWTLSVCVYSNYCAIVIIWPIFHAWKLLKWLNGNYKFIFNRIWMLIPSNPKQKVVHMWSVHINVSFDSYIRLFFISLIQKLWWETCIHFIGLDLINYKLLNSILMDQTLWR